jgi:hypothetical protein
MLNFSCISWNVEDAAVLKPPKGHDVLSQVLEGIHKSALEREEEGMNE